MYISVLYICNWNVATVCGVHCVGTMVGIAPGVDPKHPGSRASLILLYYIIYIFIIRRNKKYNGSCILFLIPVYCRVISSIKV